MKRAAVEEADIHIHVVHLVHLVHLEASLVFTEAQQAFWSQIVAIQLATNMMASLHTLSLCTTFRGEFFQSAPFFRRRLTPDNFMTIPPVIQSRITCTRSRDVAPAPSPWFMVATLLKQPALSSLFRVSPPPMSSMRGLRVDGYRSLSFADQHSTSTIPYEASLVKL